MAAERGGGCCCAHLVCLSVPPPTRKIPLVRGQLFTVVLSSLVASSGVRRKEPEGRTVGWVQIWFQNFSRSGGKVADH